MEKNQPNIYTVLEQLKIRKAKYLGNDFTFKSLDSFILGFTMAASSRQLQMKGYPEFGHFSTWLLGHLKSHFGLSGGWHWQIANRHPAHNNPNAIPDEAGDTWAIIHVHPAETNTVVSAFNGKNYAGGTIIAGPSGTPRDQGAAEEKITHQGVRFAVVDQKDIYLTNGKANQNATIPRK